MGFITEWNMPSGDFTLPLRSGYSYNMVVDWGDGSPTATITAYNDVNATHNYATAGTYQISLTGSCGAFYLNNSYTNKLKLTKIVSWGDGSDFTITNVYGLSNAFRGAQNLTEIASPIKGATICTDFSSIFQDTGISSIPSDLFSLCTSANKFNNAFSICANLTSVPGLLFSNISTSANYFNSTFNGCPNLETVGAGLLSRGVGSTTMDYKLCFYNCPKLQLRADIFYNSGEETTRFAGVSYGVYFDNCFGRSTYSGSSAGTAPNLWACTLPANSTFSTCFSGNGNNTSSIINYNSIPSAWGAVHPKMLQLTASNLNETTLNINVLLSSVITGNEYLVCYAAKSNINLVSPENIITLSTSDNFNYVGNIDLIDEDTYYIRVEYYNTSGVLTENLTTNGIFFKLAQVPTTVINIQPSNFAKLDDPNRITLTHGTAYYNGYIYGVSRGSWNAVDYGLSIFKIDISDYSVITYNTFFRNKIAQTTQLPNLEQIVECSGFLWVLSDGFIIRINPSDLDYMVFNPIGTTGAGQPIGTDGTYLYITTDTKVYKVNTALLIDSFVAYGYTGADSVQFPLLSILGNCDIIILDPPTVTYCHSIIIDSKYIFIACTSRGNTNGYNSTTETYQYHCQKIDKNTMLTVGDVVIPKCTDDMTQNDRYVFLAPEYSTSLYPLYGDSWGLLAIRKSDLTIRYLKALHSDFYSTNNVNRQTYGVQYFGDYMAVQLVNSKKTVIISTEYVDDWGADFPIGGATVKIYSFQFDGVAADVPSNELTLDSLGNFHANTWDATGTTVYKFSDPELVVGYPPVVQSVLIQSLINGTTIGGSILSPGSSDVTMVGLRYGTVSTNLDQIISFENPSINFQSVLNLAPGIYYFQAYAANSVGTSYGSIVPFVVGNTVILSHDSAGAAVALRNNNSGHAVRFCKRAWGVADGTIGSATDASGNTYKTVVINEIEWAAADLKTALYNNEDVIPEIQDNTAWSTTISGARAGYNNVLPE